MYISSVTIFKTITMLCCKLVILTIFVFLLNFSESAKILGVVPTPSYSHQIVFQPLWRELSLRGHQLTILTTDPMNDSSLTNITEIDLKFSYNILHDKLQKLIKTQEKSLLQFYKEHFKTFDQLLDAQLSHPDVHALITNTDLHFDLLIVENMHPAAYTLSKRFNCPFIVMSSGRIDQNHYKFLGNPIHPILHPALQVFDHKRMPFFERLRAVVWNVIMLKILPPFAYEGIDVIVEKHFGKEYLPFQHFFDEISLIFINTDPILHPIRPLVPAMIQIGGGVTIQPSKPLPQDLKKILDESKNGFIYFSLGSNARSKDLSNKTICTMLDTFSELSYQILWKYENSDLHGKPENVITSKWLPQQDILRHPNIKLFITHGGLQSIGETVHFKVPFLGIPIFADQPGNIIHMEKLGIAIGMDHKTLQKETFKSNILEVINNPKFKNKITEISNLVADQPMTGLEKAVWWSEYVIRHKGAKHLRSPVLDLPFYQYYLLDVIGFSVITLIVLAYLVIFFIKKMYIFTGKFRNTRKIKKQ